MSIYGALRIKLAELDKSVYLYLTKKEWATAWIEGGSVPLAISSKYLSAERIGTMTPDEDTHRQLTSIPYSEFDKVFLAENVDNFEIMGVTIITDKTYKDVNFQQSIKPALILCFATKNDPLIAYGLGKEACVEIADVEKLKNDLDEQLGVVGIAKPCHYTSSFDRNHFLKSIDDYWQHEFRIVWEGIDSERTVQIPHGTGRLVTLDRFSAEDFS